MAEYLGIDINDPILEDPTSDELFNFMKSIYIIIQKFIMIYLHVIQIMVLELLIKCMKPKT